jgi:hypothetical protein
MPKGRICSYKKEKKNVSNVLVSKNKNSFSTLPPGVVPKDAFLSLKKKNKKWNVSNIPKSKKNLPFHLTHHSRVQYLRGWNPSPEDIPKEKKKENVSNVLKSKKNTSSHLQLTQIRSPSPGDVPKEKK